MLARFARARSFNVPVAAAAATAAALTACEPLQKTIDMANASRHRVLFVTDRDGNAEIYTANAQGTDLRRLTHESLDDRKPCWTSLHARVAFVRGGELFSMFADGTDVKQLTAGRGRVDEPACSNDSFAIAFSRLGDNNYDIWRIDPSGGNEVRLTSDPSTEDAPAWSPDGARIAFLSDRTGSYQLFVMDSDGANVRQITTVGEHGAPAWSVGNRIVAWREGHPSQPASFVVIDPDGGNEVTIGIGAFGENPTWAPDGKSFLYERTEGAGIGGSPSDAVTDVFRYDLATGANTRFIVGVKAWNVDPTWQIE